MCPSAPSAPSTGGLHLHSSRMLSKGPPRPGPCHQPITSSWHQGCEPCPVAMRSERTGTGCKGQASSNGAADRCRELAHRGCRALGEREKVEGVHLGKNRQRAEEAGQGVWAVPPQGWTEALQVWGAEKSALGRLAGFKGHLQITNHGAPFRERSSSPHSLLSPPASVSLTLMFFPALAPRSGI